MRAWSVPMGVNYLIGHHHSKLELGAGINVGLYNLHHTEWQPVSSTTGDTEIITYEGTNKKKNRMEYFLYTNVGYRHVAGNGFCSGWASRQPSISERVMTSKDFGSSPYQFRQSLLTTTEEERRIHPFLFYFIFLPFHISFIIFFSTFAANIHDMK